ncbi:hypothetical protein AVDCRST_MAG94-6124 [uncultured Leptolyngbya sp.]|uniref:Uncharacterized protein n=1 Tax=uncultured Leptolyngbya sp. TaxID=332963 RepID=A0A6J4P5F3_9CYAN|nr:hypothetical protein AVDCRST_MAG94-6124 [uncultured Leptolyngbya sp.]
MTPAAAPAFTDLIGRGETRPCRQGQPAPLPRRQQLHHLLTSLVGRAGKGPCRQGQPASLLEASSCTTSSPTWSGERVSGRAIGATQRPCLDASSCLTSSPSWSAGQVSGRVWPVDLIEFKNRFVGHIHISFWCSRARAELGAPKNGFRKVHFRRSSSICRIRAMSRGIS